MSAWLWDFGDGSSSTEKNPVHIYASTGNYDVSLTVSDGINQRSKTKENYISAVTYNDISLMIASAGVYPGGLFSIPVIVNSGFSNVALIDLHLDYDTTLMHIEGMDSDYLTPDDMSSVENKINIVWVYGGTSMEIPDGDTLLLLHFRVDDSALPEDSTEICFTGTNIIASPDETVFDTDLICGIITVRSAPAMELFIPAGVVLQEDSFIEIALTCLHFPSAGLAL
ncbi:MAG: PKD domain-containing protein [Candidatus Marinimicrobia bacterium]|nr:PKD domain-containing protein [Candidatus Neomarinimicrobiota bacterium]